MLGPYAGPPHRSPQRAAKRVAVILGHQHWMLVTTLIWNALFVECLPLLLESVVPNQILVVVISSAIARSRWVHIFIFTKPILRCSSIVLRLMG